MTLLTTMPAAPICAARSRTTSGTYKDGKTRTRASFFRRLRCQLLNELADRWSLVPAEPPQKSHRYQRRSTRSGSPWHVRCAKSSRPAEHGGSNLSNRPHHIRHKKRRTLYESINARRHLSLCPAQSRIRQPREGPEKDHTEQYCNILGERRIRASEPCRRWQNGHVHRAR